MATPIRMGARASLAADQTPLGHAAAVVVTRDALGRELTRELPQPPGTVLEVAHFVELDDGRRVELPPGTLDMSLDCSEDELEAELREFVFEDELREIPELADQPRWEELLDLLARAGVRADEATLAALPFTVELDPELRELLRR